MSLDQLRKEVNKKYNMELMVQGSKIKNMQRWSSGSVALDFELGGGLPVGKIITIIGQYSDGKTSLVLLATAEYQKAFPGKDILWVDAEGSWDEAWAKTIGVDVDRVWVVQSEYQQQAFDIISKALEYDVGLVVVDSVAGLVPKEEAEASFEDWSIGLAARINSKAMRGFQSTLNSRVTDKVEIPPTIILINQMRQNIGAGLYGKKDAEPGGQAIGFHSAIKIYLRRGDYFPPVKSNYTDENVVTPKAQQIKFFIEKNKTAPPRKSSYLWWFFDDHDALRRKGSVDKIEEIFRYAKMYEVVKKRGSYFDLELPTGEVKTFQGSAPAAAYIRENPEVFQMIRDELMRRIESTYGAAEEQELDDADEPAANEVKGETSSKEDAGKASGSFWSDTLGEAGPGDGPVVDSAQADREELPSVQKERAGAAKT